ncbi:MAG TPA: Hsp20 family protein [Luteolibacter sp.]|jgi:molecular chaperone IbpA
MATLDFSPLFRSSIGFDQVPNLLAHALEREDSGYPPCNIEKCGDDQYRIVMALAGFGNGDVEIVSEQNRLTVRGQKPESDDKTYLHCGIPARPFLRHFDLADYVEVTAATMGDGLLVIDLKRELPEELKPRRIPINAGMFLPIGRKSPSRIEHNAGDYLAG